LNEETTSLLNIRNVKSSPLTPHIMQSLAPMPVRNTLYITLVLVTSVMK